MTTAAGGPGELGAENQRLRALLELGRILADPARPLGQRLQEAVEALAGLTGAERCSLMLVEGEALVVRAANRPELVGLATPLAEQTISTEVVRHCRPFFTKSVDQTSFAGVSRQGELSRYRTGSLISLPLLDGGQVVGVLNLSDKSGAEHFDEADLEAATDLAAQAGRMVNFSALHARLEEAYQELSRAQRAKDDLMYMIFHDMKAPVTAVKEVLGLLGSGQLEPAERGPYLDAAQGDLELLWRRISNLLDLSRMDSEQMPVTLEPLDLGGLCREAARRLEPVARVGGVELAVAVGPGGPALADEDLAERILVNLLSNALRLSSPEQGGGGRVEVGVAAAGGMVAVEVVDTGPGVDPALGEQVFSRYVQGRTATGSSGLGLYFCRRAARLMGGEVSFRNLPAGGAAFTLNLPAESPAP
jgi:two-component system sensor histidine kinase KdpD